MSGCMRTSDERRRRLEQIANFVESTTDEVSTLQAQAARPQPQQSAPSRASNQARDDRAVQRPQCTAVQRRRGTERNAPNLREFVNAEPNELDVFCSPAAAATLL
jgi:uncharacterized protein (DUF2345 family)